jgi:hypothetical protein
MTYWTDVLQSLRQFLMAKKKTEKAAKKNEGAAKKVVHKGITEVA